MPHQFLGNAAIRERCLTGEQVVIRATESVDVGPDVHTRTVNSLLGGKVVRGAQHVFVILLGQVVVFVRIEEAGQAHVQ